MGLYEYMFAVKCGSKYFAGFEWREKAKSVGKLVPIFIDDLEGKQAQGRCLGNEL